MQQGVDVEDVGMVRIWIDEEAVPRMRIDGDRGVDLGVVSHVSHVSHLVLSRFPSFSPPPVPLYLDHCSSIYM